MGIYQITSREAARRPIGCLSQREAKMGIQKHIGPAGLVETQSKNKYLSKNISNCEGTAFPLSNTARIVTLVGNPKDLLCALTERKRGHECLLLAKKRLEFNLCGFNEPTPFTFSQPSKRIQDLSQNKVAESGASDVYSVAATLKSEDQLPIKCVRTI